MKSEERRREGDPFIPAKRRGARREQLREIYGPGGARAAEGARNGTIALICGVLGFVAFPVVPSLLAVYFGNRSASDEGRIGRILGLVEIGLFVVAIVVALLVVFALGSTSSSTVGATNVVEP